MIEIFCEINIYLIRILRKIFYLIMLREIFITVNADVIAQYCNVDITAIQ